MNMNWWVFPDIFFTKPQKRSVLLQSQAARLETQIQQAKNSYAGLTWSIENTSASAVSAFSPPEQTNRGIAFARRAGDHLHSGVEDFLAGHHQLGLAAAEQCRNISPESAG